ncbi:MAG: hypothetical protein HY721_16335 [Planctomycetes bacterium]|nr:hypothetical protein [Planctomycetota bacterium]
MGVAACEHVYRRVDPRHVPRAVRAAVAGALRLAAEVLGDPGLAELRVAWFREESFPPVREALAPRADREAAEEAPEVFAYPRSLGGVFYPEHPGAIRLNAVSTPREAARAAIHEATHVWQFRRGLSPVDEGTRRLAEEHAQRTERALASLFAGLDGDDEVKLEEVVPCPP